MKTTKNQKYPTKDEIINCKTTPTKHDIEITKIWKKEMWKKHKHIKNKIEKLKILLFIIAKTHNKEIKIEFNPKIPSACYSKKYNTIILNNYSIISALHELGHAIYGKSELKACSWSIKLFRYSFPVAFDKLHWEGHQLKK